MSKLSVNHRAVVEGKLPKEEFLRQTRQQLPNLISQYTSYEDAIQILHNKGMLSEEVYLADVYRFPIEQMENGVRYELEQTGDYIPDEEEWEKAKDKVIEHLKKDPLYYVHLIEKGKLLEADGEPAVPSTGAHDWTVDEYKIAYIMAEYGKAGNLAIARKVSGWMSNTPPSDAWIATNIIDTTPAGMAFAKKGMRQLITTQNNPQEAEEFCKSYFGNTKSVEAYAALAETTTVDEAVAKVGTELSMPAAPREITPRRSTKPSEESNRKTYEWVRNQIDGYMATHKMSYEKASKMMSRIEPEKYAVYTAYAKKHGHVLREGAMDPKAQADSEFQKKWIYFMSQEYADKLRQAGKKPLDAAGAATKACLLIRKSFGSNWRPSKNILGNMRDASRKWKMQYMGDREVKDAEGNVTKVPTFNQSYGVNEAKNQPFRGSARGGVESARSYAAPKDGKDVTAEPWYKEAEKLFLSILAKKPVSKKTGKVYSATDCYKMVLRYFPEYKPSRDFMKSNGLEWLDRANGQITYKTFHESVDKSEEMLLKEAIVKIIPSVLSEAATANLAKLSDENATIQGIPAILNSLENIVTEIESFIIKEQSKIQGVFDNIGNIKNEDNIPIGYKFVEPILNSFKEDLKPVLEKVNFDNIKLPEAPVDGGEELQEPVEDIEIAPEEEKASVFAPRGAAPNPLAESKVKKGRYTTII